MPPADVPPIQVDTTGMWSTGDIAVTEEAMTGSAAFVAGPWRYERIEGAGQWLQLDAPAQATAFCSTSSAGPSRSGHGGDLGTTLNSHPRREPAHFMQVSAVGRAASRPAPMGCPHRSHTP
jgi:hypothetical protein